MEAINFTALLVLKSPARPNFEIVQQQEAAYFLFRLSRTVMSCDKLFLGLSFIPWGIIVWRSGFMPRIFGVLLIISGIGYIADTCAGILLQRPLYIVLQPYLRGAFIGFLLTQLWLMIKGIDSRKTSPA
ncbi:MAG TPA: DUF4386 family protein [Cyclobacteriaceae bacterium]|nr:DUF4386 family protein [Cyclobacteriaceae bacterium]